MDFMLNYICNMIKTPYTHTEYDLWDNVKINDVVICCFSQIRPLHNFSHVFAINL